MHFSGALTLTDLNDFITPSQACIKPPEPVKLLEDLREPGAASTEIRIDSHGTYYEVANDRLSQNTLVNGIGQKLEKAQVNLNDCLACSGCITSAESVLITLQSHTEVLNFLESNPNASSSSHKVPVISIAPQCLASFSASLSSSSGTPVTSQQVLRRVQAFCRQILGVEHVYDTTFARHLALLELSYEFLERKRGHGRLPMLASACPGWICYAEKAHHEMLPFISQARSPQQVMGVLIKSWMGKKWGKQPDQIYHVTVMPCYDKKLEASRQDFYNDLYSSRDVDCVITTGELELLMHEKGWDLFRPVDRENSISNDVECVEIPELLSHPGTSSGSYLHALITGLIAASSEPLDLSVRTVRTSDYEEYTLRNLETKQIVFKGAKCYGFRNLQNVVRKVGREAGVQVGKGAAGKMVGGLRARTRKMENGQARSMEPERGYDYVEVMACPGGCVNGGGQLRPPGSISNKTALAEGSKTDQEINVDQYGEKSGDGDVQASLQNPKWWDKDWAKKVEVAYWHDLPTPPASPKLYAAGGTRDVADRLSAQILVDICMPKEVGEDFMWSTRMDDGAEARRRQFFRTQYHAVESEVIGLGVKW